MYRITTLTLLIALGSLGCGDDGSDADRKIASQEFSFEEEVADQTRLVLEAINGSITITGVAEADTVTVEGTREVQAATEAEAQRGLAELQVEVEALEEEIVVQTIQPDEPDPRDFVVNYDITVPADLSVVIGAANGSVDASNLNASLSVQLANGNVEARVTLPPGGVVDIGMANGNADLFIPVDTSATFSAMVANGSVEIANLELDDLMRTDRSAMGTLGGGDGTITLRTGNGSITATGF